MKKVVVVFRISFLMLLFTGIYQSALAQGGNRDFSSNVRLNDINTQAFRHFKKNYPTISNEYWYKTDAGFVVKFTDNSNILSQVFYDYRGVFMYGVRYFEEKDLAREIKARIHKEFPDYQIDVISEINSDVNSIFLMSIKNKLSVKNIMLTDTELKVVEDIMYASR